MNTLRLLAIVAAFPLTIAVRALSTTDQHVFVERPDFPQQDSSTFQTSVGMDLTGSYGVVAVAFANGTTVNVGRVDGNQSYQEVMRKLSLDESSHPAPPYRDWDEELRDAPRRELRRARKDKGLPASDDVAVLAEMLTSLRHVAEEYLQRSVDAALAATPNLVALYREDVEDAFEYISLKSLDRENYLFPLFREPSAVAAFHNVRLCSTPEDYDACDKELNQMPLSDILTVLYTKDALCVEVSTMASVYFYSAYTSVPTSMDFNLGSDAKHGNPSEKYYWEAVKDRIKAGVLAARKIRKIEKLFLFGESSEDLLLRFWLEATLDEVLGYMPDTHAAEPIFAAARGAAELGRRGGYDAD